MTDELYTRNLAAWLLAGFLQRRSGFDRQSGHAESVVGKVAVRQVFSAYISFPCQLSFRQLPHTHHHHHQEVSLVVNMSSGLSTILLQEIKKI
jgi:hypothetical protein